MQKVLLYSVIFILLVFTLLIFKSRNNSVIDVLNRKQYSVNGMQVKLPAAGKPEEFLRRDTLLQLKQEYNINDQAEISFQFKDLTTEQAINESNAYAIALNFANEHYAGGRPGYHKDPHTNLFVYDSASAKAQEESLCQRSDLMASLTQLPHTIETDRRSKYLKELDSRNMAYISRNHLFAIQENHDFFHCRFLVEPKPVTFITSAAKYYGETEILDCSKSAEAYQDAKQRIETHLLAAATESAAIKKENPAQPVELILGAFGCGAYTPKTDPNEYRKMIATIYKELVPQFRGFFDQVTFAIPTFGKQDSSDDSVINHTIFKQILISDKNPACAPKTLTNLAALANLLC